jgi:hypothetical protein
MAKHIRYVYPVRGANYRRLPPPPTQGPPRLRYHWEPFGPDRRFNRIARAKAPTNNQ